MKAPSEETVYSGRPAVYVANVSNAHGQQCALLAITIHTSVIKLLGSLVDEATLYKFLGTDSKSSIIQKCDNAVKAIHCFKHLI